MPLLVAAGLAAAAGAVAAAAAAPPNILYIMADDLNNDWKNDRLAYMPHLRQYFRDEGAHFEQHVAAIPVYPHNTGYLANDDLASVQAFEAKHNDTVGKWLGDAGYHSAFLGKYVNSCENSVPSGWGHWGCFVSTYNFFNATMYDMDFAPGQPDPPRVIKAMTGVHQADFLVNATLRQVDRAAALSKPFFISVTPVMPHWGTCYGPFTDPSDYGPLDPWHEMQGVVDATGRVHTLPISPCPTDRNRHAFDAQSNPHIDGVWNVSITGPRPQFMATAFEDNPNDVSAFVSDREDMGWRNRSAALLDLDDMLGGIMAGLEARGVSDDTVVFFTSDNGYHLGEHKMPMGKGEPYDTDVRLPMYVRGPGVPKNVSMQHPTTHLDITATIVELAGATPHAPKILDGLSFAAELQGARAAQQRGEVSAGQMVPGDAWRQFSFSEFYTNNNTWQLLRVLNSSAAFSLVWWCTNDTEVFDLLNDRWQQHNLAGQAGLAHAVESELGAAPAFLGKCSGAACLTTGPPGPASPGSQQCYAPLTQKNARVGSFTFVNATTAAVGGGAGGTPAYLNGWVVDFWTTPPNASVPRGFAPSKVQVKVDGAFRPDWPARVADLPRPDILPADPRIPNADHGFKIDDIPAEVLQGNHTLQVFVPMTGYAVGQKTVCLCQGVECPCAPALRE